MNTSIDRWTSSPLLNLEPNSIKPNVLTKENLVDLICKEELNKTEFEAIDNEDIIVELFTQVKELPENTEREIDKLGGNIKRFGVELGNFNNNTMEMYKFQRQLLANYVHNVEGEVYKLHYYGEDGEYGQTYYIAVPADAPLVKDSENHFINCFSEFVNKYEEIMQRYELRQTVGKSLPPRSTEKYYLEKYAEEVEEGLFQTNCIILLSFALMILWYTIFRY